MLREYPGILTLSLEGNLQPTMRFYNQTGYTSLDEDWNLITRSDGAPPIIRGRYIAASLFGRLLPRYHYDRKQTTSNSRRRRPPPPPPPPIHVLVGCTDVDFCTQRNLNLQEYTEFRTKESSRLKFLSQFDTWLQTGRAIDAPTTPPPDDELV